MFWKVVYCGRFVMEGLLWMEELRIVFSLHYDVMIDEDVGLYLCLQ